MSSAKSSRASIALPAWDLSDLYPGIDSEKLARDFALAESKAIAFEETYGGRIEKIPAEELLAAIVQYETLQELIGRIGSYAHWFLPRI